MQELAKETSVVLWDRNVLDSMLKKINGTLDTETNINNHYADIDYASVTTDEEDSLYNEVVEFAISLGKINASLM